MAKESAANENGEPYSYLFSQSYNHLKGTKFRRYHNLILAMQQNGQTVIIDCGSGMCKVGLSGDKVPRTVPTIVGRQGNNPKNIKVGKEAQFNKGELKLSYPIEHGAPTNWEDMTEILEHIFYNELKVKPNQHPTLLTEAPRNLQYNREKMTEIIFEKFDVPAYYLALQAVLSLQSTGRTTGMVIDSGDNLTQVVPINEGQVVKDAIQRNHFAGRDITEYLRRLFNEAGLYSAAAETYTSRDIKEKVCFVALNQEAEMAAFHNSTQNHKTYELPDGKVIVVANQRFRATEALFKPAIVGKQWPGIHQQFFNSLNKCSIDMRKDLYKNIVLSGGNTQFPGIAQRLTAEITALAPTSTKINVVAHAQRKFLTWIGGQIFSSLSTFKDMWITRADYQESGATIVHRKCP